MSFYTEIILQGYANTENSQSLKNQFEKYCNWCWGHSFGNCDLCKKQYNKLYIPLRIKEKQKELKLSITK